MKILKGVYTALITPFDEKDALDEEGLRDLIRRQIENGIDGITCLGTTGEAPTLNETEKERIITIAREEIRRPVFLNGRHRQLCHQSSDQKYPPGGTAGRRLRPLSSPPTTINPPKKDSTCILKPSPPP